MIGKLTRVFCVSLMSSTHFLCPDKVREVPVATSHTRTLSFRWPETSRRLSGLNARASVASPTPENDLTSDQVLVLGDGAPAKARPTLGTLRTEVPAFLAKVGREDRVLPVEYAARWGELIPGAEVAIFEACGHLPQIERADAFCDRLDSFLGRAAR